MAKTALKLEDFIPYRLSFTSNLVSDAIARSYEALFGLTIPEWRLITVIAENREISQQAIGARTRMDKVTVSRAAIALFDRGLVERTPNAADRRSHLLMLTDEGCELYRQVAPKALELEGRIFGRFDKEERDRLVKMLRRIDAIVLEAEGDQISHGAGEA